MFDSISGEKLWGINTVFRFQSPGSEGYGQMMDNTETLYRASESLARAQQVSAETGNIATHTSHYTAVAYLSVAARYS